MPNRPTPPGFSIPFPVIGMVHLKALPGAPGFGGSMDDVLAAARTDADALCAGGVDGIMVENYGDTPFHPGDVPAETIAALTAGVLAVRAQIEASTPTGAALIPHGVNVLRNDARAALGIAAATGAAFVRVNVHSGTMFTDQGPITGRAHETMRLRQALPGRPAVLADVFVKHATPPAGASLTDATRDLVERGHADGVIVSGSGTGTATDLDDLKTVRAAAPTTPIWIGSGASAQTVAALAEFADGFIVGSALKVHGRVEAPVDPERVVALMAAVRQLR